jgi:hypothetical protein
MRVSLRLEKRDVGSPLLNRPDRSRLARFPFTLRYQRLEGLQSTRRQRHSATSTRRSRTQPSAARRLRANLQT